MLKSLSETGVVLRASVCFVGYRMGTFESASTERDAWRRQHVWHDFDLLGQYLPNLLYLAMKPADDQVCSADLEDAIAMSGLSKRLNGTQVIRGLDLTVGAGTVFGLLGPNGAGKTTTLRLLMGILRPSAGHALVLGHDTIDESDTIRQLVGYVPERHFVYPWMTVARVIRFTRAFYATWNDELERELQDRYELPGGKLVRHLSNGMLAKLALLLALAHEPRVLLLDEPTAGLDPLAREDFIESIATAVSKRAQTVMLSSHVVSDIERLADVVGIMHAGQMLVTAEAAALRRGAKRIRVPAARGGPPALGNGVVRCRRDADDWVITVFADATESGETPGSLAGAEGSAAEGVCLEEFFKDVIKGKQECGQS